MDLALRIKEIENERTQLAIKKKRMARFIMLLNRELEIFRKLNQ